MGQAHSDDREAAQPVVDVNEPREQAPSLLVGVPPPAPASATRTAFLPPPVEPSPLPVLPAHAPPTASDATVAYLMRVIADAEAAAAAGPSVSAPDLSVLRLQLSVLTVRQREEQERRQREQDELRVQQLLQQFARAPPEVAADATPLPGSAVPAPSVAAPLKKKARHRAAPHTQAVQAHVPPVETATAAVVIARQPMSEGESGSASADSAIEWSSQHPSTPPAAPGNTDTQHHTLDATEQAQASNESGVMHVDTQSTSTQAELAPPADLSIPPVASGPWVGHVADETAAMALADDLIAAWQPRGSDALADVINTGVDEMWHPLCAASVPLPPSPPLCGLPPAAALWSPADWLGENEPHGLTPVEEAYVVDPVLSPGAYRDSAARGVDAAFDSDGSDTDEAEAGADCLDSSTVVSDASRHVTPRDHSRVLLMNYLHSGVLDRMEADFRAGRLAAGAVRQTLVWLSHSLQPSDQEEFVAHFSRMNLSACESALRSVEPVLGVGSSTATDPTTASVAELLQRTTVVNRGLGFSPTEPAPDDDDLVARVRITRLTTKEARRKRKQASQVTVDESSASTGAADTTDAAAASHPSTSGADPEFCLVFQVNYAYQRLTGYTQAELVSLLHDAPVSSLIQRTMTAMRKDHIAACHRLNMKLAMGINREGHSYQVRLRKDGSEVYCLVHMQVQAEHGVLLSSVMSVMPLPDDPDHPPPPFVEGVDIDEETLLYGYKPPLAQAATSETDVAPPTHLDPSASSSTSSLTGVYPLVARCTHAPLLM